MPGTRDSGSFAGVHVTSGHLHVGEKASGKRSMWPCHTTQEAAYEAENWGFLTSTEGCRDGLPAEVAVSNLVAEQQLVGRVLQGRARHTPGAALSHMGPPATSGHIHTR